MMPKLKNDRHEEFCQQYLIDFNGARAARDSGYAERSAREQAVRLLSNISIKARIEELKQRRQDRTQITQDMVLKELALLSFSDFTDFVDIDEGGEIRLKTLEEIPEGMTRAIRVIQEDRILKETQGTKDKPDGEMLIHQKTKYTLHDKISPLKMLANHTGLNVDRLHLNGKLKHQINGKIRIEDLRDSHAKATGKPDPD